MYIILYFSPLDSKNSCRTAGSFIIKPGGKFNNTAPAVNLLPETLKYPKIP